MYMLHVTCCRTCAAACCRGGVHEHTVDLCGTAVLCTHQTSESERLLEFIRQFFILVAIIGPALAHLSVKSGPCVWPGRPGLRTCVRDRSVLGATRSNRTDARGLPLPRALARHTSPSPRHRMPASAAALRVGRLVLVLGVIPLARARPGYCNGQHASSSLFAALTSSGTITTWYSGGKNENQGSGIVPGSVAFGAGSCATLTSWGAVSVVPYSTSAVPTDSGWTSIASTTSYFAALHTSGKIAMLQPVSSSHYTPPSGTGFTAIATTTDAFAALHGSSGTIKTWGSATYGAAAPPRIAASHT